MAKPSACRRTATPDLSSGPEASTMPASVTTIPASWSAPRCSPRAMPTSTGIAVPLAVMGATSDMGASAIAR